MASLENRLERLEKRLSSRRGHFSRWFVDEDGAPAFIFDCEFASGFRWVKEIDEVNPGE